MVCLALISPAWGGFAVSSVVGSSVSVREPAPATQSSFWWDVGCSMWPMWPNVCPPPVKDPVSPKTLTPDTPSCDPDSTYGPC